MERHVRETIVSRATNMARSGLGLLLPVIDAILAADGTVIERGVHRNAVVVALINKLARIAWAALRKETTFDRSYPVAA